MADSGATVATIRAALEGDGIAVRQLVDELSPIVHARVARALLRSGARARTGRDQRQEIEDFMQEVFAALFADGGRALRAWDPARGASLANFVGLVAEHQAASILRSGRRNPWTEEPMIDRDLEDAVGARDDLDRRLGSRELLLKLYDRLAVELTPRGLGLFRTLFVEERSVESACAETGLSADAVYAWRSRLGKLVSRLAGEILDAGASDPIAPPRNPRGEPRAP